MMKMLCLAAAMVLSASAQKLTPGALQDTPPPAAAGAYCRICRSLRLWLAGINHCVGLPVRNSASAAAVRRQLSAAAADAEPQRLHKRFAVPAAVPDGPVGSVRDDVDGCTYVPVPIRTGATDATDAAAAPSHATNSCPGQHQPLLDQPGRSNDAGHERVSR
jgi:hypothetical protein